ncbi:MAG: hypothetical protein ACR2IK_01735 [Chloroflexota bacterium]
MWLLQQSLRMAYAIYENGLSINVMYTSTVPRSRRAVQALPPDGSARGARFVFEIKNEH